MTNQTPLQTAVQNLKAFRGRYEWSAKICHLGLTTEDLDLIIAELEKREQPGDAG